MRRRFSSHMAMLAQHGGSWGFMVDLPYLEHDKVGRMWHVHFTMAVHTVVALHPDWIPFQLFVCVKKMKQIMQNLHISLQTSKMLVWRPTIHWKQIPCRPSEKKTPALRQCLPDGLQSDPSLQRLPENILRALEEDHATKRWLVTLSPGDLRWFCSIPSDISSFVWSNKD